MRGNLDLMKCGVCMNVCLIGNTYMKIYVHIHTYICSHVCLREITFTEGIYTWW